MYFMPLQMKWKKKTARKSQTEQIDITSIYIANDILRIADYMSKL